MNIKQFRRTRILLEGTGLPLKEISKVMNEVEGLTDERKKEILQSFAKMTTPESTKRIKDATDRLIKYFSSEEGRKGARENISHLRKGESSDT